MYCAKQRALAPLVTAWLATLQDGMLMFFSPAFCTASLIPAGVISGVPTICCCLRLVVTVERPLTPITIATTPNTTSTRPATSPPISNALRISNFPSYEEPSASHDRDRGLGRYSGALDPRCPKARAESFGVNARPGVGARAPIDQEVGVDAPQG